MIGETLRLHNKKYRPASFTAKCRSPKVCRILDIYKIEQKCVTKTNRSTMEIFIVWNEI